MKRIRTIVLLLTMVIGSVGYAQVNHSVWNELLQKHVSAEGNVNYKGMKSDVEQLNSYLGAISKSNPDSDWSKNEKMAFWINAYNAFTVKLILDNYPLASIMNINNGKAWDLKFITINNKKLSLNDIEHNILRKQYKDARIHFAVNCASISCPKIANTAFTRDNLQQQLERMAKEFINNSAKNSIQSDAVKISKLFDWYKDDFIASGGSVIAFINKYAKVKVSNNASISFKEYNWNLNQ